MKRRFYIIRHGQTPLNAKGVICGGNQDVDINDEGRKQAQMAHLVFKAICRENNITDIITSTMIRTKNTADIVTGDSTLPRKADPRLNERHFGLLDGVISENGLQMLEKSPRASYPKEHPIHQVESKEDHSSRVIEALNEHSMDNNTALFVIHGGTARRISTHLGKGHIDFKNSIFYEVTELAGRTCNVHEMSLDEHQHLTRTLVEPTAHATTHTASVAASR